MWPFISPIPLRAHSTVAPHSFSGHIGQTAGCPTSQRVVYMGVAADCEYTSKYGSTSNATQAIITNWNTAGALYKVSQHPELRFAHALTRIPSRRSKSASVLSSFKCMSLREFASTRLRSSSAYTFVLLRQVPFLRKFGCTLERRLLVVRHPQ